MLNAATYSSCVHGTALPTSARRAVPRCVYRRTHRARFPRRFGGWRGVCVCGQNQVFRGRRARSLRAISSRDWPRISRGWSSLWRFDIGSSGDSISSQTSVFRHDDIAQTVNSNMNLTPVARPMSYVNHAEAGERATIHTRRTTTARDRARRGDETECLVRERELKALTRARRGTRAPGRVRSAPPARPRAASPGDAARDPWRAGRWLRRRFLRQGGHICSIDFFDISWLRQAIFC